MLEMISLLNIKLQLSRKCSGTIDLLFKLEILALEGYLGKASFGQTDVMLMCLAHMLSLPWPRGCRSWGACGAGAGPRSPVPSGRRVLVHCGRAAQLSTSRGLWKAGTVENTSQRHRPGRSVLKNEFDEKVSGNLSHSIYQLCLSDIPWIPIINLLTAGLLCSQLCTSTK